ncbi:DEAD/DEAH box helicase [Sphingosinicella sp. BN140058]|uniref:DEAD/DEAH box helicase n=1 Tax=Sphingosinicella sp. BN140058 TaxID=1892855 RepID=UPI001011D390|nr:DEAD/DEAH box helicase [Sphingosinicella sp. BN140058]QAY75260.1 DEAD/DEAH box helicase [Sphingosinicella sp. BN140058]
MFQATPTVASEDVVATEDERVAATHAALGPTVARLCDAVENGDVIAILSHEQRAEAVARACASLLDALVIWLPAPDGLPGEGSSPSVAGRRVAALAALRTRGDARTLLVTDAAAAAHRLPPPEAFDTEALTIGVGDRLDGEALAERLEALGYFSDDRVDEPGEYAVRGGTVDIFPANCEEPIRVHLSESEVDEIDCYDPVSQLGRDAPVEQLVLRPAVEPMPGEDAVTIFDHLSGAAAAVDPDARERRDLMLDLAREGGAAARLSLIERGDWQKALVGRKRIDLTAGSEQPGTRFVEQKRPERGFLSAVRRARADAATMLLVGSDRDIRFLSRRIARDMDEAPTPIASWRDLRAAPPGSLLAAVGSLDRGWTEPGLTVIAASDLLGSRAATASGSAAANPLLQESAEFHVGDAVIHEDHGLGILRGIETITTSDLPSDAFRLEYAGGSIRLVAVEDGAKMWRYGADADAVTPDRLDGTSWEKRRGDIEATIAATARQLIAIAAERQSKSAVTLDPPTADYERFSAGFPFSETADQLAAIEAVKADLASGKPMDRLVVGDVGYGKTEVALRAAAIAALAGKQVAIVAPTTVLVRQHVESFRRRFAAVGIEVAGLSRLSSAAEARAVKKGLADGSIRIVVGTKMVAGKTVTFKDLGLVVIDEEQRFGAADKAKLRALADQGHVLTLTATPIPRTLQSALVGLQDLSLITTPPARRLATRTEVAAFTADAFRGALMREKRRGGQSFVVVPRIEDMEAMATRLTELAPSLSVRRAHGKMPAAEIDEEMVRFAAGDGDVLLATNIIEAGLDIPRANTMLVWRADMFGLAQLHQLRGRVGRGRARGHFVLITDAEAEIQPATLKRLRTMEALDQLGAGFAISARDLDLRGAGELLGEEQAGHMKLIGTGLYQHLLEQAVRSARGEAVDAYLPELSVGLSGRLPEAWIPEEDVRINLYMRIARLGSADEVRALAEELEDRFGTLPEDAARLLSIVELRRLARDASIERVDAGPAAIALTPRRGFAGDAKAAGLEKKEGRLLLRTPTEADESRLTAVAALLNALAPAEDG